MNDKLVGPQAAVGRVEAIDILRGFAILGIIFFNMPYVSNAAGVIFSDIRGIGWTPADQWTYRITHVTGANTMRGMLQILLGAGLMLFARKAMRDDGPVVYADLWIRRNLWLALFGLVNVFLLFWVGDILFPYALGALLLFPFRKLSARVLLALGLAYLVVKMGGSWFDYHAGLASFAPGVGVDAPAIVDQHALPVGQARDAGFLAMIQGAGQGWLGLWRDGTGPNWVIETSFTMMIGMALFKWGLIQGEASKRFYGVAALALYGFGLTVRWILVDQEMSFGSPPTAWEILSKPARLAVTLGHIALILWVLKGRAAGMLGFLVAPGRMAFSVYLTESLICSHLLFAPYGLDLWAQFGWFDGALVSVAIILVQIAFAAWWLKQFRFGPLEWAWRSLTYWSLQPIRRGPAPEKYGP